MYVRIYWGKITPGSWDLVEDRYRELMKVKTEGLLGRIVMQDLKDSESLFTVTLWRDLESVANWEKSNAYQQVFRKAVAPYLVGSHTVSMCEVKLHELGGMLASLQQNQ